MHDLQRHFEIFRIADPQELHVWIIYRANSFGNLPNLRGKLFKMHKATCFQIHLYSTVFLHGKFSQYVTVPKPAFSLPKPPRCASAPLSVSPLLAFQMPLPPSRMLTLALPEAQPFTLPLFLLFLFVIALIYYLLDQCKAQGLIWENLPNFSWPS